MKQGNLRKTKMIRLSRIKIPPEMRLTPPGIKTMNRKYAFYLERHMFESGITVTPTYTLTDGYTTYLLAKMFDQKKIEVLIMDDSGHQSDNNKKRRFVH